VRWQAQDRGAGKGFGFGRTRERAQEVHAIVDTGSRDGAQTEVTVGVRNELAHQPQPELSPRRGHHPGRLEQHANALGLSQRADEQHHRVGFRRATAADVYAMSLVRNAIGHHGLVSGADQAGVVRCDRGCFDGDIGDEESAAKDPTQRR